MKKILFALMIVGSFPAYGMDNNLSSVFVCDTAPAFVVKSTSQKFVLKNLKSSYAKWFYSLSPAVQSKIKVAQEAQSYALTRVNHYLKETCINARVINPFASVVILENCVMSLSKQLALDSDAFAILKVEYDTLFSSLQASGKAMLNKLNRLQSYALCMQKYEDRIEFTRWQIKKSQNFIKWQEKVRDGISQKLSSLPENSSEAILNKSLVTLKNEAKKFHKELYKRLGMLKNTRNKQETIKVLEYLEDIRRRIYVNNAKQELLQKKLHLGIKPFVQEVLKISQNTHNTISLEQSANSLSISRHNPQQIKKSTKGSNPVVRKPSFGHKNPVSKKTKPPKSSLISNILDFTFGGNHSQGKQRRLALVDGPSGSSHSLSTSHYEMRLDGSNDSDQGSSSNNNDNTPSNKSNSTVTGNGGDDPDRDPSKSSKKTSKQNIDVDANSTSTSDLGDMHGIDMWSNAFRLEPKTSSRDEQRINEILNKAKNSKTKNNLNRKINRQNFVRRLNAEKKAWAVKHTLAPNATDSQIDRMIAVLEKYSNESAQIRLYGRLHSLNDQVENCLAKAKWFRENKELIRAQHKCDTLKLNIATVENEIKTIEGNLNPQTWREGIYGAIHDTLSSFGSLNPCKSSIELQEELKKAKNNLGKSQKQLQRYKDNLGVIPIPSSSVQIEEPNTLDYSITTPSSRTITSEMHNGQKLITDIDAAALKELLELTPEDEAIMARHLEEIKNKPGACAAFAQFLNKHIDGLVNGFEKNIAPRISAEGQAKLIVSGLKHLLPEMSEAKRTALQENLEQVITIGKRLAGLPNENIVKGIIKGTVNTAKKVITDPVGTVILPPGKMLINVARVIKDGSELRAKMLYYHLTDPEKCRQLADQYFKETVDLANTLYKQLEYIVSLSEEERAQLGTELFWETYLFHQSTATQARLAKWLTIKSAQQAQDFLNKLRKPNGAPILLEEITIESSRQEFREAAKKALGRDLKPTEIETVDELFNHVQQAAERPVIPSEKVTPAKRIVRPGYTEVEIQKPVTSTRGAKNLGGKDPVPVKQHKPTQESLPQAASEPKGNVPTTPQQAHNKNGRLNPKTGASTSDYGKSVEKEITPAQKTVPSENINNANKGPMPLMAQLEQQEIAKAQKNGLVAKKLSDGVIGIEVENARGEKTWKTLVISENQKLMPGDRAPAFKHATTAKINNQGKLVGRHHGTKEPYLKVKTPPGKTINDTLDHRGVIEEFWSKFGKEAKKSSLIPQHWNAHDFWQAMKEVYQKPLAVVPQGKHGMYKVYGFGKGVPFAIIVRPSSINGYGVHIYKTIWPYHEVAWQKQLLRLKEDGYI